MTDADIVLPEYARTIGLSIEEWDGERPILAIDYAEQLSGNPGMFHGGVLAAVLEMTTIAALAGHLRVGSSLATLRPANVTIEYLRPAGEHRTFATARIVRSGRRLAHVAATLWQASEDKPIATSITNIEIVQTQAA